MTQKLVKLREFHTASGYDTHQRVFRNRKNTTVWGVAHKSDMHKQSRNNKDSRCTEAQLIGKQ